MLNERQINTLFEMLTYCRPHGSITDHMFCRRYLEPLDGIEQDAHGNYHLTIDDSRILWSSHTDTVHRAPRFQVPRINREKHTIDLSRRSRRREYCLGADDTVGVFLMREMIFQKVPGHYVFHYGEESGGIGSGALARLTPELLDGVDFAIALDRAGTSDIITHQYGMRMCSDAFVDSLRAHLGSHWQGARGVYTDTAEYEYLVPECTNLSVGYYHQHTSREYVDYAHVGTLLDSLCTLDGSTLVCERIPYEPVTPRTNDLPSWYRDVADDWCLKCGENYTYCECHLSADDRAFLRYLRQA